MLCKICGAQIPEGTEKCEMCGAQIDDAQIEETVKNTEEYDDFGKNDSEKKDPEDIFDDNEKHRREQMQKMLENKKHQLSEIEKRRSEKRRKQRRNRIMLVTLICALAVAAAGIGTYYVVQNVNSNNGADTTPVPAETLAAVTPFPTSTALTSPSPAASPSSAPDSSSAPQQSWTASGSASGGSASSSGAGGTSSNRGNTSSGGSSSQRGSSTSASRPSSGGGSSSGGSSSSANRPSSGGSSSSGSSSSSSSGNSQSLPNVSQSGVSNSKISSTLAMGNDVIYNSGTGKYLMTFIIGNTKYYANVSAGSTTAQVQNKAYTITADPTQETYNGNTVYEITSMTGYEGKDYLLPYSGTRLITNSDIKGMSKYDLALARNEIYARHGRKFQTAEYSAYFSGKAWYSINPNYNYSDDNSNLNEIEIKNVDFLLNAERK